MMNQNSLYPFRSMVLLFILLNCFFFFEKSWLVKKGVDAEVLIVGNMLLFLVGAASFFLAKRALDNSNPHAFTRAIYGSFIIKFFILAIAAFIYIQVTKKNVNKPALFGCMGLYVIYTVMEVSSLTKLLRKKKNG
jgi:hypothetical protein